MFRTVALWLVGVLSVLLTLELLGRVLPVSTSTDTGYYTDPLILTYPPRHKWVVATGWDLRNAQHLVANNLGYAANRDFFRNDRAVALIGDSFVEASMLPALDRPGAQLEAQLGTRPVYAMGGPGTALLDYAERIRYAHENLGVRDFVILVERGDVAQSLCGSGNVNGPCLDRITLAPLVETLPPAGTVKRLLRHSALAQYLVSQLRVSPAGLAALFRPTSPPLPATPVAPAAAVEDFRVIDKVSQVFFSRIKPHVQGKLIILMDSDRSVLYSKKAYSDKSRERFMQLASEAGATVIDTLPIFEEHVANSALKLEVGPYDFHMNRLAVKLICQAAAGALME